MHPVSPRRTEPSIDELFAGVRAGDVALLARAITLVESNQPKHQLLAEQLLTRLLPFTGRSLRIGITGAPGVGKSTFIEAVGLHLIGGGRRVAVLAVDPSSSVSGGSILGDKTRMGKLATEPNAYIRPSPSAGTLGGVARKTRESMLVCEAAGFGVVLIETVGVGQSESMVAHITDCLLTLLLPGAGDELQGIKRGLLELVDVIAVNKADGLTKSAAQLAAQQYSLALRSLAGRQSDEMPDVLTCSALSHEGVAEVWQLLERRYQQWQANEKLALRRESQNLHWLRALVDDLLRQAIQSHPGVQAIYRALEQDVKAGTIPPESAARQIVAAFQSGKSAK